MGEQPKKETRGRKKLEIDQKLFEDLCTYQATKKEIAGIMHVSIDTLLRWCKRTYKKTFEEVFEEYRVPGLISLRRSQFEMAKRNPKMNMFLSVNYLGMSDQPRNATTSSVTESTMNSFNNVLESLKTRKNSFDLENEVDTDEEE